MNLLALKGMVFQSDGRWCSYNCGTYIVNLTFKDCPLGFIVRHINELRLVNASSFKAFIKTPPLPYKKKISKEMCDADYDELLTLLDQANLLVHGSGETTLDAFCNIISKVAIVTPCMYVADYTQDQLKKWQNKSGYNKLNADGKMILDFIIHRNSLVYTHTPYAIHNKNMYSKTYITYETVREHPSFSSMSNEDILKSLFTLYKLSLISFIDKTPRFEIANDNILPVFVINENILYKREVELING